MIQSHILIRWPKISREVMLPYTGWKLLILGEGWLLRRKLRKQKVHHNQMQYLMEALTSLYMRHSLE